MRRDATDVPSDSVVDRSTELSTDSLNLLAKSLFITRMAYHCIALAFLMTPAFLLLLLLLPPLLLHPHWFPLMGIVAVGFLLWIDPATSMWLGVMKRRATLFGEELSDRQGTVLKEINKYGFCHRVVQSVWHRLKSLGRAVLNGAIMRRSMKAALLALLITWMSHDFYPSAQLVLQVPNVRIDNFTTDPSWSQATRLVHASNMVEIKCSFDDEVVYPMDFISSDLLFAPESLADRLIAMEGIHNQRDHEIQFYGADPETPEEPFLFDLSTYVFMLTTESKVALENRDMFCTIQLAQSISSGPPLACRTTSDHPRESRASASEDVATGLSNCLRCIWDDSPLQPVLHDELEYSSWDVKEQTCQHRCCDAGVNIEENYLWEYAQALINDTENLSWTSISINKCRGAPQAFGMCLRIKWHRLYFCAAVCMVLCGLMLYISNPQYVNYFRKLTVVGPKDYDVHSLSFFALISNLANKSDSSPSSDGDTTTSSGFHDPEHNVNRVDINTEVDESSIVLPTESITSQTPTINNHTSSHDPGVTASRMSLPDNSLAGKPPSSILQESGYYADPLATVLTENQSAPPSSPQPEKQYIRPLSPPKPTQTTSRSIFTPIDEGGSVLARHFFGAPEPIKEDDTCTAKPQHEAMLQSKHIQDASQLVHEDWVRNAGASTRPSNRMEAETQQLTSEAIVQDNVKALFTGQPGNLRTQSLGEYESVAKEPQTPPKTVEQNITRCRNGLVAGFASNVLTYKCLSERCVKTFVEPGHAKDHVKNHHAEYLTLHPGWEPRDMVNNSMHQESNEQSVTSDLGLRTLRPRWAEGATLQEATKNGRTEQSSEMRPSLPENNVASIERHSSPSVDGKIELMVLPEIVISPPGESTSVGQNSHYPSSNCSDFVNHSVAHSIRIPSLRIGEVINIASTNVSADSNGHEQARKAMNHVTTPSISGGSSSSRHSGSKGAVPASKRKSYAKTKSYQQSCGRISKHRSRSVRKSTNNDGDESEDEPNDSNDIDTKETTLLFACPFWKAHPHRHSDCYQKVLRGIPELKQHLLRVHKSPEWYCFNCHEDLVGEEQYQAHFRANQCCQATQDGPDLMRRDMQVRIKKRTPGRNPRDTWYDIYKILFPESSLPASPYLIEENPNCVEHMSNLLRTLRPETLQQVLSDLGQSRDNFLLPQQTERVLAQALQMCTRGVGDQQNTDSIEQATAVSPSSTSPLGKIGTASNTELNQLSSYQNSSNESDEAGWIDDFQNISESGFDSSTADAILPTQPYHGMDFPDASYTDEDLYLFDHSYDDDFDTLPSTISLNQDPSKVSPLAHGPGGFSNMDVNEIASNWKLQQQASIYNGAHFSTNQVSGDWIAGSQCLQSKSLPPTHQWPHTVYGMQKQ